MRPDYENLYELGDPFLKRYMRLTIIDQRYKDDAFEEFVRSFFSGECVVEPSLSVQHDSGGSPADFIWTDYPPITVISQNLFNLLTSHGFTGWDTYNVRVLDKSGKLLAGDYHGFAITGRAGGQNYKKGEVVDKPPIVPAGKPYQVLKGYYFEDDYWDGSDFSSMAGIKPIIVTKGVFKAFKKAKIKNVEFTRLTEREIDVGTLKIAGVWP